MTAAAKATDVLLISSLVDWLRKHPYGVDLGELAATFSQTPAGMRAVIDYVWSLELYDSDGQVDPSRMFDFDADGLEADEPWVKLTNVPVEGAPKSFDADELALVLTGLDVLRESATSSEASRIDELQAKLRGATTTEAPANRDPQLELIRQAIDSGRQLRLRYSGEASSAPEERTVDPLRLESRSGLIYLNAYCHLRQALRWFRSDRIFDLEVLDTAAAPHTPAQRNRALEVTGKSLLTVSVAIRAGAVAAIRPYFGTAKVPEIGSDGWIRADLRFRSPEVAARLAAEHAGGFVVTGPPEVRELVAEWLRGALIASGDQADNVS
ncbi:helix-turn-helix transcriptional regulator [Gulosibacter sediminis]|uniref:helix-turn-helix transcriptional regulator n=1 Tax=Gulosibacter sediminis TaxID=1729695 RepID=UPI0024A94E61|nr:WYL domain-containing protein [Gulosibacter sediminis]